MSLNRASVRRHIAATKPCREANRGIQEILLEAQAGSVKADGGGRGGASAGRQTSAEALEAGDVLAEIQSSILIPCRTL